MPQFDYASCSDQIRQDMPEAYREVWRMIAKPGSWWSGEDRVSIAAETRQAVHCDLCATRKSALSPFTVKGEHASVTNLPNVAVDAVHRLVTDVSRLTEQWLLKSYDEGMTEAKYIELLGIVVAVISIDGFHHAMGLPLEALPEPAPGAPSGYRPSGVADMGAWVDMIPANRVTGEESDLYGGAKQTGNVIAAMSLVPDSVRMLKILGGVQYLQFHEVANPGTNGGRAISRPQIELLAGRVSALSDCFY